MAVVDMTDDLMIPAPASLETRIHGVPEGYWYNFVQWSDDSKHLSFTLRSSGARPAFLSNWLPVLHMYMFMQSPVELAVCTSHMLAEIDHEITVD